jgi:hypothetical protein
MMIAGTARSGTTWLADIIVSQIPCRIMFEPFHSKKVAGFSKFHYFQYMRPTEENNALIGYCRKVFTGDIRNGWIDRQVEHMSPKFRIIKDIRANLFLKWIQNRFPEVPILFIIRHPCAVVLSRMQLGWATDTDIRPFLCQPNLVEDFLADKLGLIEKAKNPEQKHAIIWCVSNLVPIEQFNRRGLNFIFYENLCLQPETEIPKIFGAIKCEYQDSVFAAIKKPSTTAAPSSAILAGRNKVTRWQKDLSTQQIDNILSIVREFELDHIYDDAPTPLIGGL